jgi:hypothetical protein
VTRYNLFSTTIFLHLRENTFNVDQTKFPHLSDSEREMPKYSNVAVRNESAGASGPWKGRPFDLEEYDTKMQLLHQCLQTRPPGYCRLNPDVCRIIKVRPGIPEYNFDIML